MYKTTFQTFNDIGSGYMNETYSNYFLRRTLRLSSLIVCLLGMAGNGFVIWFLCFRIKRNPVTVYILNLAVADFLLLISQSIWLFAMLISYYGPACVNCEPYYLHIIKIILRFAFSSSILFLTAISMERCIAVVFPIWYKCRRPRHLSTIICPFIWVLAFTVTILWKFSCTYLARARYRKFCKAVSLSYSVMYFGVVSPPMVLSSLVLIIQVQRKSMKRQPKRLYWAILLNLLVFLVCTFPTRLVTLLMQHLGNIRLNITHFVFFSIEELFTFINSAANPFIYFLVGRDKKRKSGGSSMVALHRVFGSDTGVPSQNEVHSPPTSRTMELELSES